MAGLGGPSDMAWVLVAWALAHAYRAPLLLAHAVDADDDAATGELVATWADARARTFDPARVVLGDLAEDVSTRVIHGRPGDALRDLAEDVDAMHLVTGTRSHGAFRAALGRRPRPAASPARPASPSSSARRLPTAPRRDARGRRAGFRGPVLGRRRGAEWV